MLHMKHKILLLAFLLLATFASYAQTYRTTKPINITNSDDLKSFLAKLEMVDSKTSAIITINVYHEVKFNHSFEFTGYTPFHITIHQPDGVFRLNNVVITLPAGSDVKGRITENGNEVGLDTGRNRLVVIPTQVALPVTLTYFRATQKNNEVHFDWQSASEVGFSHYDIQRSQDGETYESIASVNARGNSSFKINYTYSYFEHYNGTLYYRLVAEDLDGTREIFKAISLRFSFTDIYQLNHDHLRLYGKYKVDILEVSGKCIGSFQQDVISFRNLRGVYVLRIYTDQAVYTEKIWVNK
jgi:hypothetical protein